MLKSVISVTGMAIALSMLTGCILVDDGYDYGYTETVVGPPANVTVVDVIAPPPPPPRYHRPPPTPPRHHHHAPPPPPRHHHHAPPPPPHHHHGGPGPRPVGPGHHYGPTGHHSGPSHAPAYRPGPSGGSRSHGGGHGPRH